MTDPSSVCEFCAFWRQNHGHYPEYGRCVRRSPVVEDPIGDWMNDGRSGWPVTRREDWCGEFRLAQQGAA